MNRTPAHKDRKLERLAEIPELRAAAPRELAAIASVADPTTIRRGTTVVASGSTVRWVYLVHTGQIGIEQTPRSLTAPTVGTFAGDLAAFAGCESPHSITALSDLEAFAIANHDFVALFDNALVVRTAVRATLRAALRSSASTVAR